MSSEPTNTPVDAHAVMQDVITKIQKLHDPEHHEVCYFRAFCCMASAVVATVIAWRSHAISKKLKLALTRCPEDHQKSARTWDRHYDRSKKVLNRFATIVIVLQLWNMAMAVGANTIIFSIQAVKRNINHLPPELFSFPLKQPTLVLSQQNKLFFMKDLKLYVVVSLSLILYKVFLNASHHIIHLIVDISKHRHMPLCSDDEEEDESEMDAWESNKLVSFNENITVVEYSPSVISSKIKPTLGLNHTGAAHKFSRWFRMFKVKRILRQYVIPFWILVLILPFFLKSPMVLLTTSSTLYIHSPEYLIRFDHVFCATVLISLFNNFKSLRFSAPAFPTMTLLLAKFCWVYGYLTLVLSSMALPFFADILACWLKIMCNAITNDSVTSPTTTLVRVQVLTLSVTQFLRHALLLNCYLVSDCTNSELTPGSFLFIRDLLVRAWMLLNQCYLVVLPCVLWIFLIEWKLAAMV